MGLLRLYSIFHLNLAYSSIPEEKRGEVIQKCFWPLLKLAVRHHIPIALEAPGYTLEITNTIDPEWIQTLRKAIAKHQVEFIASGYTQLIAPLVPALVNEWNLNIGNAIYKKILGIEPKIWYINEQTFSAGIVPHYLKIGAEGVIMEWNNPKTFHPKWASEYQYFPQKIRGTQKSNILCIWNNSITFQKIQRLVHGEITEKEMLAYLRKHLGKGVRNLCLYGNDAEIFDFRPGRFPTEAKLEKYSEWNTICKWYIMLRKQPEFQLIFPSETLITVNTQKKPEIHLHLESSADPIPVKKQPKYNITRWAVTGRNSVYANTRCFEIFERIHNILETSSRSETHNKHKLEKFEKQLCYLWSSDFRTHITQKRWRGFLKNIELTLAKTEGFAQSIRNTTNLYKIKQQAIHVHNLSGVWMQSLSGKKIFSANLLKKIKFSHPRILKNENGKFVNFRTENVDVTFNRRRGMSLERVCFPKISSQPLVGSIPHGYFESIDLSADWYTGNMVLQRPGKSQVTDLEPASVYKPQGKELNDEIYLTARIDTELGPVYKEFHIYKQYPQIDIAITFQWGIIPLGSFKGGIVTLIPESYNPKHLFYATKNGGYDWEVFPLTRVPVKHDTPSSSIVSASAGLGATEGVLVLGDDHKGIAIAFDQKICAAMPMIEYKKVQPTFFCRALLSCGEIDESRTEEIPGPLTLHYSIIGLTKTHTQSRRERKVP